ncbi:hypothetical protein ACJX0J_037449, partial [Zea mays]
VTGLFVFYNVAVKEDSIVGISCVTSLDLSCILAKCCFNSVTVHLRQDLAVDTPLISNTHLRSVSPSATVLLFKAFLEIIWIKPPGTGKRSEKKHILKTLHAAITEGLAETHQSLNWDLPTVAGSLQLEEVPMLIPFLWIPAIMLPWQLA